MLLLIYPENHTALYSLLTRILNLNAGFPIHSDAELQIYLNFPVWKIATGELYLHLFKSADLKLTTDAYAPTRVLCCLVRRLPDVLTNSHGNAASRRSLYYWF